MKNAHSHKLQFITPNFSPTFYDTLKTSIDSGVEWVQIRLKDIDDDERLKISEISLDICRTANVRCIINDNPIIANKIQADGVHLGKMDMSPSKAREILGKGKIIGGTANTFEDIEYLHSQQVDYIGLGPFRYTETKKNLSPILGIEGYISILEKCRTKGITTPIYAIGGISIDDIGEIVKAGVYGIAVSGLISQAKDKATVIQKIYEAINI